MTDPLNESCIPYGQVPRGAFFRLARLPEKLLQKTRVQSVAINEQGQMALLNPAEPCILESRPGERD